MDFAAEQVAVLTPRQAETGEFANRYTSIELSTAPVLDSTPPTIGSYNPTPGTPIHTYRPIAFTVTDNGDLRRVMVIVSYASGAVDVAHDGDAFRGLYFGSRVAVAGGWRYTVARGGGWPAAPTFEVRAIDTAGNETSAV